VETAEKYIQPYRHFSSRPRGEPKSLVGGFSWLSLLREGPGEENDEKEREREREREREGGGRTVQKVFPLNYFSAGVSSSLAPGELCPSTRERTTYDERLKKVSKVRKCSFGQVYLARRQEVSPIDRPAV